MTFSRKVTCPYCGAVDRIAAEDFSDELVCRHCQRAMFASKPAELTAEQFQALIGASETPVLVDFWASWCGPCKAMAPAFEAAARTMEERVKFAKLNTDEEQEIAQELGIRSIPTMILFRDGAELARHSGAMMAGDIEQWVNSQLEPAASPA
jgi:thioredoxin 2